uniref:Uncharacterized protein n=1 Tax=Trypanosoma vivax (strain Y486) TaxID=1055687 RepID=G0U4I6_TRYVY|nr:hypothetical protein TVY486_1013930 [Trypanosoma vivax Y486]
MACGPVVCELWMVLQNGCFRVRVFINTHVHSGRRCERERSRKAADVFIFVVLFFPSFSVFPFTRKWCSGVKRHIVSFYFYVCVIFDYSIVSLLFCMTLECRWEGEDQNIKKKHKWVELSVEDGLAQLWNMLALIGVVLSYTRKCIAIRLVPPRVRKLTIAPCKKEERKKTCWFDEHGHLILAALCLPISFNPSCAFFLWCQKAPCESMELWERMMRWARTLFVGGV